MTVIQLRSEPTGRKSGALRTIAIALGSGLALFFTGEAVWTGLIALYTRNPLSFPWFVPAMSLFLAAGVALLKLRARRGGDHWTTFARLNAVSLRTLGLALLAGWASFFAGAAVYVAWRMTSGLGGEAAMTIPSGPKVVVLIGLAMAALVAGVVEEVSIRGMMQSRLERAFGVAPAILISGVVWALLHTNHSYFDTSPLEVMLWFGIFLAVSAILGTIAHVTNSVWPGIVVHTGFDAVYFVSAGILQPKIAPIAFLESLATPRAFVFLATGLAIVALPAWLLLVRAARAVRS